MSDKPKPEPVIRRGHPNSGGLTMTWGPGSAAYQRLQKRKQK